MLNRHSTLPRHFLLRPYEGSSVSHPLGPDGCIGFFARRLYGFDGLCDASAVLLVFLVVSHAVSYSALQAEAIRRIPVLITRFRAVAARKKPCTIVSAGTRAWMTSVYWEIHQCETTAIAIYDHYQPNKADNIQPTNRASAGKASTKRTIIRTRCKAPMRTLSGCTMLAIYQPTALPFGPHSPQLIPAWLARP
jgi:hypothetical protein